jgi:hypothetical protein
MPSLVLPWAGAPRYHVFDVARWLAFLFIPLAAAAGDRWISIRSGPFQVLSSAGDRSARQLLNQLEQVRYLLGAALGKDDLKTDWPVRIVIAKPLGAAVPVLTRDTYTGSLPPDIAMPPQCLREVVRILIESNAGRMPAGIEAGLADFYSTAQASGPKVTLGAPPPPARRDQDWARIDLLSTSPDYAGKLRVLLYNLQRSGDLLPSFRNAFAKTPAQIDTQAAALLASGNFPTILVSARPLNPERDFTPRAVEGPLGAVAMADLERSASAYQALVATAPAEAHEGLGLLALAAKYEDEARKELAAAVEAGSTSARAWLECARLNPDAAKAKTELQKAAELNPNWDEPAVLLAAAESDDSQKLRWLKTAASLAPRNAAHWVAVAELYQAHEKYPEAAKAWAAAQDASVDDAERERILQARRAVEDERVAYEAAERKRIEDEKRADIERVKQAAMAQIRAAEERANSAHPLAPNAKPQKMDIGEFPAGKVRGTLIRTDCLGRVARLVIRDAAGKQIRLLVRDPRAVVVLSGGSFALHCGVQRKPRAVSVEYQPTPDAKLGSVGEVVTVTYE